jgi:hypothetical protein
MLTDLVKYDSPVLQVVGSCHDNGALKAMADPSLRFLQK